LSVVRAPASEWKQLRPAVGDAQESSNKCQRGQVTHGLHTAGDSCSAVILVAVVNLAMHTTTLQLPPAVSNLHTACPRWRMCGTLSERACACVRLCCSVACTTPVSAASARSPLTRSLLCVVVSLPLSLCPCVCVSRRLLPASCCPRVHPRPTQTHTSAR
jgi:hypothetical protein